MAVEQIIIEEDGPQPDTKADAQAELVSWVMPKVDAWRDIRESTYRNKWDEWYHIWRGQWTTNSKSRKSERSKVISPASQIAVDTAAAELLEALFSREQFIDLNDDIMDEQKEDALVVRDRLLEDLRKDGIVDTMAEVCTLGALYGQFLAKIVTEVERVSMPKQVVDRETGVKRLERIEKEKVRIYPVPLEPGTVVPDSNCTRVEDMLGIAHEFRVPEHTIKRKQEIGTYYDVDVSGELYGEDDTDDRSEEKSIGDDRGGRRVKVIEWHGYVPTRLLAKIQAGDDEAMAAIAEGGDNSDLTDAIVTIANGSTLLRAIPNPSVMEDRAIVAEQFDTVPNRFWGRGVMEKGFNMQKSLDSELRARQDGLAWTNNPMLAYDLTALPPGMNIDVWPGKAWGMHGNPGETLMPLQFGSIDPSTFTQASEFERMLQFATGAVDPSILNGGVRDQATGASAVNVSGIVKRNKRTMLNLESFVTRMVRGIVWRKMKFDPDRYPADYEFVVRGTVGIMARKVEQQFLVQMVQFTEPGSMEQAGILKLIVEQSASPAKADLLKLLEAKMQPPEPDPMAQQMQQLQLQDAVESVRNKQADTAKKLADAGLTKSKEMLTNIETELLDDRLILDSTRIRTDMVEAESQARQVEVSERKQALAEAEFAREGGRINN